MAEFGFDLEDIARLIKLVEARGLAELVLEDEDRRVVVRGASYAASRSSRRPPAVAEELVPAGPVSAPLPASPSGAEDASSLPAGAVPIASPMVGVFYRAASPDLPPLVEEGDHVEAGEPYGIIEAMKVFSEIEAEQSGTVVRIVAENGALVRSGEALLFIVPE